MMVELAYYGTYGHERGLQVVDESSALRMSKNFNLTSNWWRRLIGIPVFIGHPDDDTGEYAPGTFKDFRVYGRIYDIRASTSAVYVDLKLNRRGLGYLKRVKRVHLSPRWGMVKLRYEEAFSPVVLLSVGLTDHPNVRGGSLDASTYH